MKHCETCGQKLVPRRGEGPKKWAARKYCRVECAWGRAINVPADQIAAAYASGIRVQEIQAEYNIGSRLIYEVLNAAGVPRRRTGPQPDLPPVEEVAGMIRSGRSLSDLESLLRKRHNTIKNYLIAAGYDHLTGKRIDECQRPKVDYKASDTGSMHYIGGTGHWGGLPMREAS